MDVDSLPTRPLTPAEVSGLNAADAVDLAVAVDDDGPATGLLVATDAHVTGLALEPGDDGGRRWRAVVRLSLAERERFDALRAAEESVRSARLEPGDVDAV